VEDTSENVEINIYVNLEKINVVLTFKSVDETIVCDHSNDDATQVERD